MTKHQTPPTKTTIGEHEVEESKMEHIVANQEEKPAISNEEFTKRYGKVMTPKEVEKELNNQH